MKAKFVCLYRNCKEDDELEMEFEEGQIPKCPSCGEEMDQLHENKTGKCNWCGKPNAEAWGDRDFACDFECAEKAELQFDLEEEQ